MLAPVCMCVCVCVCVYAYCGQREGKYPPVLIISYDTFRLHAERLAVNGLRHLCLRLRARTSLSFRMPCFNSLSFRMPCFKYRRAACALFRACDFERGVVSRAGTDHL